MTAALVYLLCALASALCATLLLREYLRRRTRLLFWSSLSFGCFTVNNAVAFADFVIVPQIDLALIRASLACAATILLLFGLVWDLE
jgi:hypothetical protein